jgi:hypothetical protein
MIDEAEVDRRFREVKCRSHVKGFKTYVDPKDCFNCGETRRMYRAVIGMSAELWTIGEMALELEVTERTIHRVRERLGIQAQKSGRPFHELSHQQKRRRINNQRYNMRQARFKQYQEEDKAS